ncbi:MULTISPECIES: DUF3784 domain-containing protein [Rossellomorea]|uniref:DUF3784 domain-containing protein n=1 Tax=Rossellomorea TaxID=2837508 RepID=UPI001CC9EDA9|nr:MULTISPECIES: DUF3784 domain-containing protein [Rossellomorea]MCA0149559.1 DUF3784 domain-containing protein [Rossellomorea vietnamensis]WGG46639.1 DUF3784 domain-containing protein [Rossellomorea sp. DA94]
MYTPFILCICLGLLIVYTGYLIWVKKKLNLIAGYQEDVFKDDKEKLAKMFGLYTIVVGIMTMILPFALEYVGLYTGTVFGIVIGVGTVALSVYVVGNRMRS